MNRMISVNARWAGSLAIAAWVALVWFLALFSSMPPKPLPSSAPASAFSAERATVFLSRFAAWPRPVGSAANQAGREAILKELAALGWETQEQKSFSVMPNRGQVNAGHVVNILARKKGSAPAGSRLALAFSAHHDSVPTGPGAADDAASVAALLEMARALGSGPALKNDLILIITDGEEAGLLGGKAFASEHPWAKDVGLILNFEFRGNAGAMVLFETSAGNARLVEAFASAAPLPMGSSLNYEVYKRLPNDTDMSAFKSAGLRGLNFAAIDGHSAYHTAADSIENLSQATLQHEGETMLALARRFGDEDLRAVHGGGDAIFFNALGLGMVHFSIGAGWGLLGACCALWLCCVALARRQGAGSWVDMASGAGAWAGVSMALILGIQACWSLISFVKTGLWSGARGDPPGSLWYLAGLCALGTSLCARSFASRSPGSFELDATRALGSLGVVLAVLATLMSVAPGASFALAVPALGALAGLVAALGIGARFKALRHGALWLGAAPAILILAPLIRGVFIGLGPALIIGAALFFCLLLAVAAAPISQLPLLARAGLGVFGALCLAGALSVDQPGPKNPTPQHVFYVQEGASARWMSRSESLPSMLSTLSPFAARTTAPGFFAAGAGLAWSAPAVSASLAAPFIELSSDAVHDGSRRARFHVGSRRGASELFVEVSGVRISSARLNGKESLLSPSGFWDVRVFNVPAGVVVEVEAAAGFPLRLRAVDRSFGLPGAVRGLPVDQTPAPGFSSMSSQSVAERVFK